MSFRKHIPNAITCLNLLSGCAAILVAIEYRSLPLAASFIILGAVFDFFDGMAARLLNVKSPIGADLDSLADVVSFGVAPAVCLYIALSGALAPSLHFAAYGAFLLAAFAALRLAKFNNDTRQTTSFIGLPVPANALFWIAYVDLCFSNGGLLRGLPLLFITLLLIFIFSFLMVSELPMLSLKVKSISWRDNKWQYILVMTSAFFVTVWGLGGFAPAIIVYILMAFFLKGKDSVKDM